MRLELLVVAACPNEVAARDLLRDACRAAGVADAPVTVTVVGSDEEAVQRGFTGSPTFLIDGVDPFATPGAPVGLTCRVYPTGRGTAGVPELGSLQKALIRRDEASM